MPDHPFTPTPRPGIVPWLVGGFALWQLVVIPLVNLFEFVPLRPTRFDTDPPIETAQRWGRFTESERLQQAAEGVGYFLAAWAEATGQDQGWIMFTPGFPPHTVVLAAEFRFPDGTTDRSCSRFYPADLANPRPRWPVIDDREFNFEANIFMLAWDCDPRSLAERPEEWKKLPERVRENEHLVTAWLRWQSNRYRAAHPEKPEPTEVVLLLHYIPTPLPGEPADWTRRPAFERPFARWCPGALPEPDFMAVEGFDPVANRFVRLKQWPRP
jgi:hypothetical protein